jgi:hypothetical protein
MFFAPAYCVLKLIASVSVKVVPLDVTELPARSTAHWELNSVLLLPSMPCNHVEPSLSKLRPPALRS